MAGVLLISPSSPSLFLPYAETASLGLSSLWDFLEMGALLAHMFLNAQEAPRTDVGSWPRQ